MINLDKIFGSFLAPCLGVWLFPGRDLSICRKVDLEILFRFTFCEHVKGRDQKEWTMSSLRIHRFQPIPPLRKVGVNVSFLCGSRERSRYLKRFYCLAAQRFSGILRAPKFDNLMWWRIWDEDFTPCEALNGLLQPNATHETVERELVYFIIMAGPRLRVAFTLQVPRHCCSRSDQCCQLVYIQGRP